MKKMFYARHSNILILIFFVFATSFHLYASEDVVNIRGLDNFDDVRHEWIPSGDGAYTCTISSENPSTGEKSMKVVYSKDSRVNWPFFALALQRDHKDNNFSYNNILSFWVYAEKVPLVIKAKLEDYSFGSWECDHTINEPEQWIELKYDFSYASRGVKLEDLRWIVFFADPHQKANSGSFYIDDIIIGTTESFAEEKEDERVLETIDYDEIRGKNENFYISKGIQLYNGVNIDAAWVEFKKALIINPYSAIAAYYFGQICEKKNKSDMAVMVLNFSN